MYDSIIIGAGPAGMSAAIYMARQKLDFIILSKNIGGYVAQSSEVGNYLGFHLIDGNKLADKFEEHVNDYDVEIRSPEEVVKIKKIKKGFKVKSDKDEYETKSVLIATGEKHRKLDVPGEKKLEGKGVTYCATCDAPLFKDKDIAIVGGGNSAMEAALFGAKYSDNVYIININKKLQGSKTLIKRVEDSDKIKIITKAETTEILGDDFVSGLKYKKDGKEKELEVQGVFIEIGLIPVSDFVDIVKKNKKGEIITNKKNATGTKGIFAAGDVTDVTQKQIAVAVGEGCKAGLAIIKYVQN